MEMGLSIDEKEFLGMKPKEQMCVLYRNQVTTLKLVQGYKFHQKVQYVVMSIICGAIGLLFRLKFGA